jgi:hypothetical protein
VHIGVGDVEAAVEVPDDVEVAVDVDPDRQRVGVPARRRPAVLAPFLVQFLFGGAHGREREVAAIGVDERSDVEVERLDHLAHPWPRDREGVIGDAVDGVGPRGVGDGRAR